MSLDLQQHRSSEKGFTLVELAVVMIIIGLLIAGILKGQELIQNAELTATISQIKGVDAAFSTFRDKYSAVPGDMTNANSRLPNCTNAPCTTGTGGNLGNSRVDTSAVAAAVRDTSENFRFWAHLSAADLLTGIDGSTDLTFGAGQPEAEIGSAGGFHIGYYGGGGLGGGITATGMPSGHYLWLVPTGGQALPTRDNEVSLTPNQAARIDSKLDDGLPQAGSVRAGGNTECQATIGTVQSYNEANGDRDCSVVVRVQG